jgi:hypothetical protein
MKRGTLDHPKTRALARLLRINRAWAGGILEALWQFTAEYYPAGDVGRATDTAIAEALYWPEDRPAEELIGALTGNDSKFLDRSERHRLVVHDWPDHCSDFVHIKLARARQDFADGRPAKLSRLSKGEREKIDKEGDERSVLPTVRTECAEVLDSCAQADQSARNSDLCAPPGPALPGPALTRPSLNPAAAKSGGGFVEPPPKNEIPGSTNGKPENGKPENGKTASGERPWWQTHWKHIGECLLEVRTHAGNLQNGPPRHPDEAICIEIGAYFATVQDFDDWIHEKGKARQGAEARHWKWFAHLAQAEGTRKGPDSSWLPGGAQ